MKTTILATLAALAALFASPVLANGVGFYHEFALSDPTGTTYLGKVTDPAGNPVPNTKVIILAGDQHVDLMTDNRGRYRLTGVPKKLDPKQVKISVSKRGYEQIRAVNMSRKGKPGLPVEIDFVIARQP